MAISAQAGSSGIKPATTGTTITSGSLTTTTGDALFVAVSIHGAQTVSSVTDSAGNTYHQVGRVTNGATQATELWKTDNVRATGIAAGTVVVTLSASGSLASMCVESYRNIAYAGQAAVTATGSSVTASSGAVAQAEATDFVIGAFGSVVNTAFTSTVNGTVRQSSASNTTNRCGIGDATGSLSVTDSLTCGNGLWAVVVTPVRALAVLSETMTPSDAMTKDASGVAFLFADAMEIRDLDSTGQLTGIEAVDPNGFAFWRDGFRTLYAGQYALPLSDGMQFAQVLGAGAVTPGHAAALSVQSEVWLDSLLLLGPLLLVAAETISLSDALGIGYGCRVSEQLVMTDGPPSMVGQWQITIICPHLGDNWADAASAVLGGGGTTTLTLVLADQDTTWLDALGVGYGLNVLGNQMTISDAMGAGYGAATSDQIILVDSLGAGYGAVLSDNLNNWLDLLQVFLAGTALQIQVQDSLNSWTDALLLGYGLQTSDDLNQWSDFIPAFTFEFQLLVGETINSWLDALFAGYGVLFSEQVVIVDSLGAGYGAALSDSLNNWLDTQLLVIGLLVQLSDQDTSWADALGIGYGLQTSDSLNLWLDTIGETQGFALLITQSLNNWADAMFAGYGMANSDQMIIVDSLGAGYGAALSDTMNSWLDLVQMFLAGTALQVQVQDSINNWSDALGAGYGNAINDQMAWQDQLGLGYGLQTSDSVNLWQDLSSITFGFNLLITQSLNNWLDAMFAGYGVLFSDQVIIVDSIGAGYGAVLSDSLNNWLDLLQKTLTGTVIFLDLSDQDTTWLDALGAGYGNQISDQLQQADSLGAGYGGGVSDSTNNWSDALGAGYGNAVSDQDTSWADTTKLEFGFVVSPTEQLQMLDFLRLGYGLWITDNGNNWLDLFQTNIQSSLITVLVSDSLNNWLELLGAGYGNQIADQVQQADSLGIGYGMRIADDGNSWLDSTPAFTLKFQWAASETLNNWLDAAIIDLEAASAFALLLTDQVTTWLDSLGIGYGLFVGDQITWLDQLLIAGKFFGPTSVQGIRTLLLISIERVRVRQLVSVQEITGRVTTSVERIRVQ